MRACSKCCKRLAPLGRTLRKDIESAGLLGDATFWTALPRKNREWNQHTVNKAELMSIIKEYLATASGSPERAILVKSRREMYSIRREYANVVGTWQAETTNRKRAETAKIIQERENNIMERLKALGYSQEDFVRPHSESLDLTHRWDKLVKRRQVLTEDGWTKVLPELTDLMERRKQARIKEAKQRLQDERKRKLYRVYDDLRNGRQARGEGLYLSFNEYLKRPWAKKFLQAKAKGSDKTTISQEEQEEIRQEISDLSNQRLEEMKADCARIVRDGMALHSPLPTVGKSAKAKGKMKQVEKEHSDADLIQRPSALYTPSLHSFEELVRSVDTTRSSAVPSWSKAFPKPPSNLVRCAEALAAAVFPTETVTVHRVLSMRCMFVCNMCPPAFRGGPMTWKDTVKHFVDEINMYHTSVKTRAELKVDIPLLNDHDVSNSNTENPLISIGQKVVASERKEADPVDSSDDELLLEAASRRRAPARLAICGYCKALHQTFRQRDKEKLDAHLLAKHGVTCNPGD